MDSKGLSHTNICIYSKLGEGNGTPRQYSCLESPMDGGAWWAAVHGVAKSRARLSNFTFTFHFHALEKEMASHSSVLAWRIPWTEEPGGLPSMGSHRVEHDWSDLAAAAADLSYMAFTMLRQILSMPIFWRAEFCQRLFLHLLRLSYGFYLSIC